MLRTILTSLLFASALACGGSYEEETAESDDAVLRKPVAVTISNCRYTVFTASAGDPAVNNCRNMGGLWLVPTTIGCGEAFCAGD